MLASGELASEEKVHKKGTSVDCWTTATCRYGGKTWPDIFAPAIRPQFNSEETAPSPEFEPGSKVAWWHIFLQDWNGVSILAALGDQTPSVILTSDASGGWGCGAFYEEHWFQLAWKDTRGVEGLNIATKELIPIVIAIALWGRNWTGQVVQCQCDNSAVVAVIVSRTSKDQDLMHLL